MKYGIIAAGHGSRLGQEGHNTPKPLVCLEGEPMIGRLIKIFDRNNAESIAVIVNENMPEVLSYIESLSDIITGELKIQTASTPSSMHTMELLTNLLEPDGKFIVTTVDTVFREGDFHNYVKTYENLSDGFNGCMALTGFIDDEKPLYVKTSEDMIIEGFFDKPVPGIKYISAGIYGMTPCCLEVLHKCIKSGMKKMRNFQRELINDGKILKAYDIGKVVDVDHISDIETASNFLTESKD